MNMKIKGLSKNFKYIEAVKNVDLELKPGLWGLLGPNGAGKTTLMRMMVGNLRPSTGNIYLNNRNILELDDEYLDKIGYLPQNFGYDKSQNVIEFLNYIGVLKGLNKTLRLQRIDELLEQFNLLDIKKRNMDKLSGGMKRRVGICQALLNDPEILIVDEPTVGLDIEERSKFQEYLSQLSKDKIVILSTHIVSDVEFIANYFILMNNGQIIDKGKSDELIDSLEGKVFEAIIDSNHIKKYRGELDIISSKNEDDISTRIRYIGDRVLEDSEIVKPNLNDYYLYRLNNKERI